jgi:hypothetical protein
MIQLENLVMQALQNIQQQNNQRYDQLSMQLENLNNQLNYFVEVLNTLSNELAER